MPTKEQSSTSSGAMKMNKSILFITLFCSISLGMAMKPDNSAGRATPFMKGSVNRTFHNIIDHNEPSAKACVTTDYLIIEAASTHEIYKGYRGESKEASQCKSHGDTTDPVLIYYDENSIALHQENLPQSFNTWNISNALYPDLDPNIKQIGASACVRQCKVDSKGKLIGVVLDIQNVRGITIFSLCLPEFTEATFEKRRNKLSEYIDISTFTFSDIDRSMADIALQQHKDSVKKSNRPSIYIIGAVAVALGGFGLYKLVRYIKEKCKQKPDSDTKNNKLIPA